MKKYSVLVVDDSSSILSALKNFLSDDLDIDVYTAKTMKETAKVLLERKGKFEVVLADLGLPDAPQGEIIDFLKKFSLPIIVLTGSDTLEYEEKFKNKNIVDYIIKDGISALEYASSIVKRIINNKNIKILLVDDSKTFISKAMDLLLRYKYNALYATDGKEAYEILKKNSDIKVILTDYLMPNMNGLELTKKIRTEYSKDELSIIVTSNDKSRRIPAKFLKLGANDFLYKGFSDEEFFARINSTVETLELFEKLKKKVNVDYLTGLYNRRYLFEVGKKYYQEFKEENKNFAVAIIDIDNFKSINDNYGHDIGDIAIKEVANILNKNILNNRIISRLGGEEFCILFYNREKNEVIELLEYIRISFEKNIIKLDNSSLSYTVSIGCTFDFSNNLDSMIQLADKSLYNAKDEGRNKVRYR